MKEINTTLNSEPGSESEVLRKLHKIQLSVPDWNFFANWRQQQNKSGKKKKKEGFFSGAPFLGSRSKASLDLHHAREQVKSFHNSFLAHKRSKQHENPLDPGMMSIASMNDFRKSVKDAAEAENAGLDHRALAAIVKFIDLKNSGIVSGKQEIVLDCLGEIGATLHEDGNLSMFHTTWFLSVYKEYLSHFRMFSRGNIDKSLQSGGKEAALILKKLQRKQFEIPQYLRLVSDDSREVKQINRFSIDPNVKRSKHAQIGCTYNEIKAIFFEKCNEKEGETPAATKLNEVKIIMSYAQLFSKIPMMHQVAANIRNAIPNLNTETSIYKHKIATAQKLCELDIAKGLYWSDSSEEYNQHLYKTALSAYLFCCSIIKDNRLDQITLKNDTYTFPFLHQAHILISYQKILKTNRKMYLQTLESSLKLLETVKACSNSTDLRLRRSAEQAVLYIRTIEEQITQTTLER